MWCGVVWYVVWGGVLCSGVCGVVLVWCLWWGVCGVVCGVVVWWGASETHKGIETCSTGSMLRNIQS